MLDTFRKASKTWVVKLLFTILALSFLAWGGNMAGGGLFGHGAAIEVGSYQFTANDVNAEFKREIERLQPMFGGKLSGEEARKLGLLDTTIESMVSRSLVEEAAKRLGLAASQNAVVAATHADPNFRNAQGQFDRDLMRRLLSRAGLSETAYIRQMQSNMVREQMAAGLAGQVTPPAILVDSLTRWREERRVVDSIAISDDSLPAPVPDQAQIEQFYKDHAQRFMAPEYRALTVLLARSADLANSVEITPDMIQDAYQARIDEFQEPERRQASQVVLADQASADKAASLIKAGKDLSAIAKETNGKVVDLGLVERGGLPDELADPVFTQASGTTVGPVRTPLGWHVVKIGAVTPAHSRSLDEAKPALEQELRKEKANDLLAELGNKIEDSLSGGASLEDTAAQFSLRVLKVPAVDAQGKTPAGKPATNLPKGNNVLDVAFHTDQGTESPLTELENEGYFLVRVDQITQPQPRPLLEVKAEVQSAWQAQRRHEMAKERADKALAQIKTGASMADVAKGLGTKVQTSAPFTREGGDAGSVPPTLVQQVFTQKVGDLADSATQNGWVLTRLSKVVEFDPAKNQQEVEAARRKIGSTLTGDLIDQYMASLRADIGVKVDRSQLAREE